MSFNNDYKIVHRLKCLDGAGDVFMIAGKPYDYWTKKFGLPLHINFESAIIENIREFKRIFAANYTNGKVCFSLKTYPHPRTALLAAKENIGVDVVSTNELRCALEAGIEHDMIDLNGNAKTHGIIKQAVENHITIVADNIADFKIIAQVADKLKITAAVLLRVSGFPVEGATDDSVLTANEWTKFGENLKNIPDFIKTIDRYKYVNFLGFHTHIGTQITDLEVFLTVMKELLRISLHLKETGHECKALSIGGGFPIRYVSEQEWDVIGERIKEGIKDPSKAVIWRASSGGFKKQSDGTYDFTRWCGEQFYTKYPKAEMLEQLLKAVINFNGTQMTITKALEALGSPRFVIEPGRGIVADTGITIMRAAYTRQVVGHNLLNTFMGATSLGESLFYPNLKKWLILNDHKKIAKKPYECFIAGNLCFSGDMLSKYKVFLQRQPKYKDTLMVYDTGGTGQHFTASNANSFARTTRVLIAPDGSYTITKQRDTFEEIYSLN